MSETTPVTDKHAISCNRFNLRSIPMDQVADNYVDAEVCRYWERLAGRAMVLLDQATDKNEMRSQWDEEAEALYNDWLQTQQPGSPAPRHTLTPEGEMAEVLKKEIERVDELRGISNGGSAVNSILWATLESSRDALESENLIRMSTAIVALRQHKSQPKH